MIRVIVEVPERDQAATADVFARDGYEGAPEHIGRWLAARAAQEIYQAINSHHRSQVIRAAIDGSEVPELVTATDWSAGTRYSRGDTVDHDGVLYLCTRAHEGEDPPADDAKNWRPLEDPVAVNAAVRAARRRREAEEAGIILTMPDGSSFPIPTGREDRAMMDGAVLMLSQDPGRVIRWKAADGTRVPVDAPTLLAINAAVWEYVEECFDREGDIADDPENEDPDEGWPDRHRTLDLGG